MNENQYRVAKEKLAELQRARGEGVARDGVSDEVAEIARAQLGWLEEDIANEIAAYELDRQSDGATILINGFGDIRTAPMRYRRAKAMTVKAFAEMVDVHPRQIARYEVEEYANCTTGKLEAIISHLPLTLKGRVIDQRQTVVETGPAIAEK